MDIHQGRLSVESVPDGGSIFILSFSCRNVPLISRNGTSSGFNAVFIFEYDEKADRIYECNA